MNRMKSGKLKWNGRSLMIFIALLGLVLFTAPTWGGTLYLDSGQMLGGDTSNDVALGDVDGDGDRDVFVANGGNNRIWLNSGSGAFSNSGQTPGTADSAGVALGDLDGDTDRDAFVANTDTDNQVWLNNGAGVFSDSGQVMNPAGDSRDVALGDLDGDHDIDAFVANDGQNEVWFNNGAAQFSAGPVLGGDDTSHAVALGDLDGDTDLDVYVANGSAGAEEDEIWFNDGDGSFTADGQALDMSWNEGVTLGDLDGDTDLDVYLATWFGNDTVWLNNGNGQFNNSGQNLSGNGSLDVTLVDVDDDTDLDALVAKNTPDPNEIWLNDGNGQFSLSSEGLDSTTTYAIAAGDLDGDHDPDLFTANFGPNHVWFRGGFGIPAADFNVETRTNPAGHKVYPWAQVGDALLPVLLAFPPAGDVEVVAEIESSGGTTTETIPISSGNNMGNLTVDNPQPQPSETVSITLSTQPAGGLNPDSLPNPLHLVFTEPAAANETCWLCFSDWLLQLLGFEPSFWALHHVQLDDFRDTPSWDYYAAAFTSFATETTAIVATHPPVLWDLFDTLELWTPAIQAVDDGQGDMVVVTQEMVDTAVETIGGVQDAAGPELADWLEIEMEALDVSAMAGMTMEEVHDAVLHRAQEQLYLPIMHGDVP